MNRWKRWGRTWVFWSISVAGGWSVGLAGAQTLSVTSPEAIEFYFDKNAAAGVPVELTVTNAGDQSMAVTLRLVNGQGEAVDEAVLVPAKPSPLPADETRVFTARLRPSGIQPQPQGRVPWTGFLQVKTNVAKPTAGTNGTEQVSVPVKIYSQQAALFNRPGFFGGPVLLALGCLLLAAWLISRKNVGVSTTMVQAQFKPSESWVSNFTVLGSLGSALVAIVALDGPNKIMFASATAISAALIALAPLVYSFFTPGSATIVQDGKPTEVKTGPVWGYLAASFISVVAGVAAVNLILNLIPRVAQPLADAQVSSNLATPLTVLTYAGLVILLTASVLAVAEAVETQVHALNSSPKGVAPSVRTRHRSGLL
jgi:hypothetical protein